jgi:hypothetical protein
MPHFLLRASFWKLPPPSIMVKKVTALAPSCETQRSRGIHSMEGKGESKRKETTTYETNKHRSIFYYCHRTLNLCHLRSGSFPLIISKRNGISVFRGVSVICIGTQRHSGQITVLLVNNYNNSCVLYDKQSQIKKDNDPPLTSINLPFRLKKQTFS